MKGVESSRNITVPNLTSKHQNPFSKAEKIMKDQEKLLPSIIDKTHMKALTQKFFTDMLSLEIAMTNRSFSFSTIEQLVQLYAVRIFDRYT